MKEKGGSSVGGVGVCELLAGPFWKLGSPQLRWGSRIGGSEDWRMEIESAVQRASQAGGWGSASSLFRPHTPSPGHLR